MRVFLGSDHAAYELKEHLRKVLGEAGHEPVDCGAFEYDAQDDYPPFCFEVGERTVTEPGSLGVVIGGSGNGEQIAANKVPGVRAALSARRYPARIDLVLEVRDRFCDWNDGRWHLWGHPAGAFCDRTDRDPDLVLDIETLSAAYLGGVSLATLQAAGRVTEVSPGAVTQAGTAFRWPVTPWCPDEF